MTGPGEVEGANPWSAHSSFRTNSVSLVAQMAKNPTRQETWVHSLGREDPLEKGMATHYSILA